jgi:RNA polymerase sigma factor (sigma-70 family)
MSTSPLSDESLTATRGSLLARLRQWDDAEGWREFFDTYGDLLYRFAVRSGLDAAAAQDAVQEVMLAVAKQMPQFRYDPAKGSFRAWLYTQARWRIADSLRRRQRDNLAEPFPSTEGRSHAGNAATTEEPVIDPLEAVWDAEWRENQLARALAQVKTLVSPSQFQMFQLAAIKGWDMTEITRTLKVRRAQVYMARMRVGRLLRRELARLKD